MREKQMRDYSAKFNTREDGESKVIEGYFARYDGKYELWGDVYETIAPGAFDETLNEDIVCLWNHNTCIPLGRTTNGSLQLRADSEGLSGSAVINNADSDAVNAYERIKRGDVKQCSFGFDILDEEMIKHDDGSTEFKIKKVKLYEVSPVTFPAYKETSIGARKAQLADVEKRELQLRKEELRERVNKLVKSTEAE